MTFDFNNLSAITISSVMKSYLNFYINLNLLTANERIRLETRVQHTDIAIPM